MMIRNISSKVKDIMMNDLEMLISEIEAQRLKMVNCYNRHSTVEKNDMYKQWHEADTIFNQLIQKLKGLPFNLAQQPQLDKHDVSRSADIEKQTLLPSEVEIVECAKRLWQQPMKLAAVKEIMKLGYGLKEAKEYCERHFG